MASCERPSESRRQRVGVDSGQKCGPWVHALYPRAWWLYGAIAAHSGLPTCKLLHLQKKLTSISCHIGQLRDKAFRLGLSQVSLFQHTGPDSLLWAKTFRFVPLYMSAPQVTRNTVGFGPRKPGFPGWSWASGWRSLSLVLYPQSEDSILLSVVWRKEHRFWISFQNTDFESLNHAGQLLLTSVSLFSHVKNIFF